MRAQQPTGSVVVRRLVVYQRRVGWFFAVSDRMIGGQPCELASVGRQIRHVLPIWFRDTDDCRQKKIQSKILNLGFNHVR